MRPIVLNFLYPRKHHTKYLLDSIANCFSNTKESNRSKRASVSRAWTAKWGWHCHTSHPQTFPSELKEKSIQSEASGGLLSHSTGENQLSFLSMKWKNQPLGGEHPWSEFLLSVDFQDAGKLCRACSTSNACHRATRQSQNPGVSLYYVTATRPHPVNLLPFLGHSHWPENATSLSVSCQCQWQRFSLSSIQYDSVCCSRSVAPPTGTTRSCISYSIPSWSKSRKEPSSTTRTLLVVVQKQAVKVSRARAPFCLSGESWLSQWLNVSCKFP